MKFFSSSADEGPGSQASAAAAMQTGSLALCGPVRLTPIRPSLQTGSHAADRQRIPQPRAASATQPVNAKLGFVFSATDFAARGREFQTPWGISATPTEAGFPR